MRSIAVAGLLVQKDIEAKMSLSDYGINSLYSVLTVYVIEIEVSNTLKVQLHLFLFLFNETA